MSNQTLPKGKEIFPGLQLEKVDDRIMTLNVVLNILVPVTCELS